MNLVQLHVDLGRTLGEWPSLAIFRTGFQRALCDVSHWPLTGGAGVQVPEVLSLPQTQTQSPMG